MTTFENKCAILAELWLDYRYEAEYADFIAYNDLGLPLAYAIHSEIVSPTDRAVTFIDETFAGLLSALSLEDENWKSFGDILAGEDTP